MRRHFLEVIGWASTLSGVDLYSGKGKRALDVGCAYGYAFSLLQGLGYESYGVDLSKWGAKRAKDNVEGQFLICDAQARLPFRKKAFDLVTCFDVLEHLYFPEHALKNMFETCRGVMVCTTPNKFVEKPIRKAMQDFDETHINVKFPNDWQEILKKTLDFTLLKVETFYDLLARFGNRQLFFKSIKVPHFGLTIRILVKN